MKLVRLKSFETNSSSSHSVTVVNGKLTIKDVDAFKNHLLTYLRDGKVLIDLVERYEKHGAGSLFGVKNKVRLLVSSEYRDENLEFDSLESDDCFSETFFGLGDYVGKLIMVLSVLMISNYDQNMVMCVFDHKDKSDLEERFPYDTDLANLLLEVSELLDSPLVFNLGTEGESFSELDDLACSICDENQVFEDLVGLEFLVDLKSYVRSTYSSY